MAGSENAGDPEQGDATEPKWAGDVLGRARLAAFLGASLAAKAELRAKADQGSGLTVALDAGWGTGKTFFIKHWAEDLKRAGHPVVVFDAWENDIGDEAAVALMAAIQEEVLEWHKRISPTSAHKQKVEDAAKATLKGLRRAVLPTAKALGKGLLKRYAGLVVDDLIDEITAREGQSSKSEQELVDKSLDAFFESAISDHGKRKAGILEFKSSLSRLLDQLSIACNAKLPLFVFVDEVDRCRPSYAIRLLEEIKHVFGVPNTCFVVSTNLEQLTEAIKAVYGQGFNARSYVSRFFDEQHLLPEPDYADFAAFLLAQPSIINQRKTHSGLPRVDNAEQGVSKSFAIISKAFELDLRSQKQVFALAETAASTLASDKTLIVLWLFFLAALRHSHPSSFLELTQRKLDHPTFITLCKSTMRRVPVIKYERYNSRERQIDSFQKDLVEVIWAYYDWSLQELPKLMDKHHATNAYDYPAANIGPIASELPQTYYTDRKYRPSISKYLRQIQFAGLLGSQAD